MIVLKQICQEYDLDPYSFRMQLRKHFGKPKNRRWKWQPDDPELPKIREFAASLSSNKPNS